MGLEYNLTNEQRKLIEEISSSDFNHEYGENFKDILQRGKYSDYQKHTLKIVRTDYIKYLTQNA